MKNWYSKDGEYSSIQTRTRSHNRLIEDINSFNEQCIRSREERKSNIASFQRNKSPVLVICPLCDSQLRKHPKKTAEIYKGVHVPIWTCPVDRSRFQGCIPNIVHCEKKHIKAIVQQFDGVFQ